MKKSIGIFLIVCLLIGAFGVFHFKKSVQLTPLIKTEDLWISHRPLPKDIALDAYLSANVARSDQDLERATKAYLRVLEKDPENTS